MYIHVISIFFAIMNEGVMNILVKSFYEEYILISFENKYMEILILEIKCLGMCASYWFIASLFQSDEFVQLYENGAESFKYSFPLSIGTM